jgi:hypothetical protein
VAAYVVLGIVSHGASWVHGIAHTLPGGGGGDNGQEVWFLAWGAHALTHLTDPLRTDWLQYPYGADLANNTSMPLAGFIGTPITLLFGPIATYNVLFVAAFAGSATAMMFVVRRWVDSLPAAFLAGLLYGFSPYMVGQGAGHLFELIAFVPPLALMLLDEILIEQRRRWWVTGVGLGLLAVVELGFSLEMFADMVLVAVIGMVVLLIARADVRSAFPQALKPLGLATAICLPVAGLFAYVGRTGPAHASGPIHHVAQLLPLSSDLTSLVAPTSNQLVNFGLSSYGSGLVSLSTRHGLVPDLTENGAYIGIPLLLLLIAGLIKFRHNRTLQFFAGMGAASYLLSMGARLKVFGHNTAVPLPFAVLTHVPFLNSEAASRYTLFTWLFIAPALAIIVDQWLGSPLRLPAHRGSRQGAVPSWKTPHVTGRVLPLALLTAGLVGLIPHYQYMISDAAVPPWFQSSGPSQLKEGSVLLTYPYATAQHNGAQLWQALNGFRYRIPDGEVAVPIDHAGAVEYAFEDCWSDPSTIAPPAWLVARGRAELMTRQVATIVVPSQYTINPACAVRFLTRVLGRSPAQIDGASVWTLRVTGAAGAPA